eukprot:2171382-Alexandrium_andersonii.AAC.1
MGCPGVPHAAFLNAKWSGARKAPKAIMFADLEATMQPSEPIHQGLQAQKGLELSAQGLGLVLGLDGGCVEEE